MGLNIIYSCLFGEGLRLLDQDLAFKEKGCKYVLFTDQKLKSNFWDIFYVEKRALPDRKASRLAKISATRWLPSDTNISIYIDNSVLIQGSILEFAKQRDSADFMMFKHPSRSNVLEEVSHLNKLNHPEAWIMFDMLERYQTLGFDLNSQLGMGGILVRNHANDLLRTQEDLWLEQLLFGCERDQISLGFSLWRSGIKFSFSDENIRENKFFKWPVR